MNPGAAPGDVTLPSFKDLRPGERKGSSVVIAPAGRLQLVYRLATGRDTIALDTLSFAVAQTPSEVTFSSAPISLTYRTTSDGYRLSVSGQAANAPPGASLVIDLPSGFRSIEADTLDDTRHFAFAYKIPRRDANSIAFSKLEPGIGARRHGLVPMGRGADEVLAGGADAAGGLDAAGRRLPRHSAARRAPHGKGRRRRVREDDRAAQERRVRVRSVRRARNRGPSSTRWATTSRT